MTLNDGDVNLVTEALYNPFGPESRITRGNGSVIFGYLDQAYRPFVIGNGTFYDVINYDENGNPATFYSTEGNKVHDYDALNRLDTSSGPFGTRDYVYDSNGNRTGKTSDSITDSYSYDPNSNRMNTNAGSAVVLDANGNTTSLYGMTLNYTADNRLASIAGNAAYTYNGLGERVMKGLLAPGTAGSYGFREKTVYTYDQNGKLLAELGSSGKVKQEYIYMNDELLSAIVYKPDGGEPILNADMDGDGAVGVDDYLVWYFNHYLAGDLSRDINADGLLDTSDYNLVLNCALSGGTAPGCFTASYSRSIYYAHNDHLGTPHVLTNETGAVVWSATYDPFGEATVNDDHDSDGIAVTLNIRFPGQYYDVESRLHYNYFRYYDPESGRYITSDPLGMLGGINTYNYTNGNPMSYIDPHGLIMYPGLGDDVSNIVNDANNAAMPSNARNNCESRYDLEGGNDIVWYSYWGTRGNTAEEIMAAAELVGDITASVVGLKILKTSASYATKNQRVQKTACALGFAAACSQGELRNLGDIAEHLKATGRISTEANKARRPTGIVNQ